MIISRYGSFKILIDLFFRAPKGERALEKVNCDFYLLIVYFKWCIR